MVVGQCVAALIIDHYGWMGMPIEAVTVQRVIGVGLVAVGVIVIRIA
jgi:transporter family-2 protein